MPDTRKLGRTTAHRKSMMRGLVTLLFKAGKVETTYTRAKDLRRVADKMVTLAKANTLASRRAALAYITDEAVVAKLFNEIAPEFENRNGGYTQIYRLGPRRGDGAEMAMIKLVGIKTEAEKLAEADAKKSKAKKETAASDAE